MITVARCWTRAWSGCGLVIRDLMNEWPGVSWGARQSGDHCDQPPPIACEAQCDSGGTVSRPHRVTRVARGGSDQQRPVSGNSWVFLHSGSLISHWAPCKWRQLRAINFLSLSNPPHPAPTGQKQGECMKMKIIIYSAKWGFYVYGWLYLTDLSQAAPGMTHQARVSSDGTKDWIDRLDSYSRIWITRQRLSFIFKETRTFLPNTENVPEIFINRTESVICPSQFSSLPTRCIISRITDPHVSKFGSKHPATATRTLSQSHCVSSQHLFVTKPLSRPFLWQKNVSVARFTSSVRAGRCCLR